jgi:excisionase family DNA binding protein
MRYHVDNQGHMLMPWGTDGTEVDASAVRAVVADLPKHAKTVTPVQAAEHLCCSLQTVYNMIDSGELLCIRVGARGCGHRGHRRIVVCIEREFDPARATLLSLEEAKKRRSNIGG